MDKYKVLVTDFAWPDLAIEREILAAAGARLVVAESTDAPRLAELAADVDAIMTCWAQTGADVIGAAPGCRIVARMGIGLDNIDVSFCTQRGILVTNVPDYCVIEVAEHTMGLLFALSRNIGRYHQATKQGRYALHEGNEPRRLEGATLGVIGVGRIGRVVSEKAHQLGMKVLGVRRGNPLNQPGIQWVCLAELLKESDFISLHLPLNDETRRLFSTQQFAWMKTGSYLINTSRGGVVDHDALAAALASGHLAGAALDVQDPEPPPLNQPPFNNPNVIVTPHAAFVSDTSVAELRRRAAEQVATMLAGGVPANIVNPSVLTEE